MQAIDYLVQNKGLNDILNFLRKLNAHLLSAD